MAAEKLTKGRLAQILFMMLLLASVFTWRSVTYSNNERFCEIEQNCIVEFGKHTISTIWQNSEQEYHISIQPDNKNWTIEQIDHQANLSEKQDYWVFNTKHYPVRLKLVQTESKGSPVYYLNYR
ncbi:hypothetical protein R3X26_08050 [Vibrio sp. TH_r3]|uniref:hypothetical protein n=1 Tax=Vibrio sp. TH_r3 TaxID=3082084 RepID=UPI002953063F|nr:hypothetical protein [Vibrio sp. TH_r3]MDV7104358.1 hypothetical protein [Vibrio sp. TH_r3]